VSVILGGGLKVSIRVENLRLWERLEAEFETRLGEEEARYRSLDELARERRDDIADPLFRSSMESVLRQQQAMINYTNSQVLHARAMRRYWEHRQETRQESSAAG
jgi:hypothetical protein